MAKRRLPPFPKTMTLRQQEIALAVLGNPHMDQADIGALVGWKGKPSTRSSHISRLISRPDVANWLADARLMAGERAATTIEDVLAETGCHAFYDPGEIAKHPMTGPADIEALPEHVRRCITGWKCDSGGNFIVTLADKNAALERLSKYLGMFVERKRIDIHVEISEMSDKELEAEILELSRVSGILPANAA